MRLTDSLERVPVYSTKVELRTAFGCSSKAVDVWTSRSDWPGGHDGPWDHEQVVAKLEEIRSPYAPSRRTGKSREVGNQAAPLSRIEREAKAAKTLEEVRRLRRNNDRDELLLIDAEEVEQRAAELCAWLRDGIERLPDELEMLCPPDLREQLKREVSERCRLVLRKLAAWKPTD